jgi:hypothetical protein
VIEGATRRPSTHRMIVGDKSSILLPQ